MAGKGEKRKLEKKNLPATGKRQAKGYDSDYLINRPLSTNKFALTFEGLTDIIDKTYSVLDKVNSRPGIVNFSFVVSRSVFSYYIWQHLYARLNEIRCANLGTTCRYHKWKEYPIPLAVETYLTAIGNCGDFYLDFPVWPNEDGHFGRVSKETHYMYETMAAPIVLLQRIKEDLAYTENPDGDRVWNLPENLAPKENTAGYPTKNLLGWDFREKLTPLQVSHIGGAMDGYSRFKVNIDLMYRTAHRLNSAENIELVYPGESTLDGSKSLMIWLKRKNSDLEIFERGFQYTEQPLSSRSFHPQHPSLILGSQICCVRVKKEKIGNLDSYCCYDFNQYREVPAGWQRTRNVVFDYGNANMWNSDNTSTSVFYRTKIRKAWLGLMFNLYSYLREEQWRSQRASSSERDPFCRKFDIPYGLGWFAYDRVSKFTVSFEALNNIIEQGYQLFTCHKSAFKEVPKSVFSYYIWMYLYARLVFLKGCNNLDKVLSDLGKEEQIFLNHLRRVPNWLPLGFDKYLSYIGNVIDRAGNEYLIDFPVWPNNEGHFGRISATTHFKYELLAAPLVLARRIQEDLAYTMNPEGPEEWNLPDDLSPTEGNAGYPTKNLLGWNVREKLTKYQKKLIESCGITANSFPCSTRKFMLNTKLLFHVGMCFGVNGDIFKLNDDYRFKQKSVIGSTVQTVWQKAVERNNQSESKFSKLHQHFHPFHTILSMSFCQTHDKHCYRLIKEKIGNLDSYCCYDFNEYRELPDDWRETRNEVFNYGDVGFWNKSTFQCDYIGNDLQWLFENTIHKDHPWSDSD